MNQNIDRTDDRLHWWMRSSMILLTALIVHLSPFTSCVQAQPVISICHTPWYEFQVDSTSLQFHWKSNTAVIGEVWMGTDSNHMHLVRSLGAATSDHRPIVSGLTPATIYFVKLVSTYFGNADTVRFWTSTASDYRSSEAVQVYFNRSVDTTTYPLLPHAIGNADFMALLHTRILNAKNAIDLALFSFGDRVGDTVVSWLVAAKARGVNIRFIMDSGSVKNSPAYRALLAAGIPAITNGFGASGHSWSNIHHNKFIVFDGRGKDSLNDGANAWVQTGSWNLTDQQTTTDFQNLVYLQDLALAHAYEREFEEEWGSATDTPDSAASRFSMRKTDNTPRSFNIGGREVHLFFSPDGGIPDAIDTLVTGAAGPVLLSMYDFTLQGLASTLIGVHSHGVGVHGIVGRGGSSDQTSSLAAAGLDVLHFSDYLNFDTLFHHKYCILSPNSANGWVLTGSFNWTHSADSLNNENVLFIRDRDIADQYFEEWLARYHENGGSQTIVLPAARVETHSTEVDPFTLTPNPARDHVELVWQQSDYGPAFVTVFDLLGNRIERHEITGSLGLNHATLTIAEPPGSYLICLDHDGHSEIRPYTIVR
jgi:phosphatidylserine/phosphatidylglycerophosphate/cardiolipin synthase-like enzyme